MNDEVLSRSFDPFRVLVVICHLSFGPKNGSSSIGSCST